MILMIGFLSEASGIGLAAKISSAVRGRQAHRASNFNSKAPEQTSQRMEKPWVLRVDCHTLLLRIFILEFFSPRKSVRKTGRHESSRDDPRDRRGQTKIIFGLRSTNRCVIEVIVILVTVAVAAALAPAVVVVLATFSSSSSSSRRRSCPSCSRSRTK